MADMAMEFIQLNSHLWASVVKTCSTSGGRPRTPQVAHTGRRLCYDRSRDWPVCARRRNLMPPPEPKPSEVDSRLDSLERDVRDLHLALERNIQAVETLAAEVTQ